MRILMIFGILFFIVPAGISQAVETEVVVRAKSKDAKFIGTSMGGAKVVIRDSTTGEILSKGFTRGGTGDTAKLMKHPHKRHVALSDESAAKYTAVIDINEPRFVNVEVLAPFAQQQSVVKSSTQVWLIPGKDITGDGIIVEIPGFAIDVLSPRTAEKIKLAQNPSTVRVKANVVMMCGCPIEPGGIWDSNQYEVETTIIKDGENIGSVPLKYAGETSLFHGDIEISEPGTYELIVHSYDPVTGNTGVDRTTFKATLK